MTTSHEVRAEMVANVLRVEVSLGTPVQPGETLLLLESMKMEIPVLAEVTGTVTAIRVAPGTLVQEGDVLVIVESR